MAEYLAIDRLTKTARTRPYSAESDSECEKMHGGKNESEHGS